jgi:ubiquinone/menaquinone biosynthesis C-methylase UbiE
VTSESAPDDHVAHNRAFWDRDSDAYQEVHGAELAGAPLAWGAFRIPESELQVLGDVRGRDLLELGCGAAQWSAALSDSGARITGLDISRAQLAHARRAAASLPLVLGNGESLPFAAASFDVVFCDHGALSFCEPAAILPECSRVLRPNGLLAFCGTHPLLYLTYSEDDKRQTRRLHMEYRDLGRQPGATIDWVLAPGEWIRLLRANGFEIEDLVELVAPEGATTTYEDFAKPKWARRWPAEWIWKARRSAPRT